jgi:heptosyltransferase-1
VLDLQGLLKSALWARQAGAPVAGLRPPPAPRTAGGVLAVPAQKAAVPRELHAVQRCRCWPQRTWAMRPPQEAPEFGLRAPAPAGNRATAYGVLIPNASRPEKLWPERHWVAVGRRMRELGWTPWCCGAATTSRRWPSALPPVRRRCAAVPEGGRDGLRAGRRAHVVGLDTGFTHLAAALGRPTLGIYCDHEPGLAGITGPGQGGQHRRQGPGAVAADVLALLEGQQWQRL